MGKYSNFSRDHFASMLTYYREMARLTRMELANKIGVAPSTITCYEQGNREPKIETYNSLANVLKIDPIQFFISDNALEVLTGDERLALKSEKTVSGDTDGFIADIAVKMHKLSGFELQALSVLVDSLIKQR